jgi:hypothetical protein
MRPTCITTWLDQKSGGLFLVDTSLMNHKKKNFIFCSLATPRLSSAETTISFEHVSLRVCVSVSVRVRSVRPTGTRARLSDLSTAKLLRDRRGWDMAIHFGMATGAGNEENQAGWSAADRHAKVVNHVEINTRCGHILHALVRTLKPKRGRYY